MLFNSYTFFIFFLVVLIVYYRLGSWRNRKMMLIGASYLFYAAWNPPFVVLLWISTVADWFFANRIAVNRRPISRKFYLVLSLLVNLGLLAYFKYGSFLLDNFVTLLSLIDLKVRFASPSIVLPVGISFYTFQTLSYSLDVYFGKTRPWHSFIDYALYVTFFPQLVAGPIVRAVDYLPQCHQAKPFSSQRLGWGMYLIVLGMFQKVVIADGFLAPIAEMVYEAKSNPGFLSAWLGTFAFAGQIFCDFAGYSTCAIGAALCLGFSVTDNFHFPYAAIGFSDFWKRWHISLSSWLRDYLYIPLGGNRKGVSRTYRNLMVTMLLGGLWHGAAWTFVIWGGLHGAFLVIERSLHPLVAKAGMIKRTPRILWAILTFLLVCFAWVFFRAHSLDQASRVLGGMLGMQGHRPELLGKAEMLITLMVVGAMLSLHWFMRETTVERITERSPWWLCSMTVALMLVAIMTQSGDDHAFIYFQF